MNWKRINLRFASNFQKLNNTKTMNLLKVTAIATLVFSTLTFTNISTNAETGIKTVYHVYINQQYIGTVSDKEIIEKLANEKINNAQNQFENDQINIENEITYIPEQVFRPQTNDDEAVQKASELFTVKSDATAIVIDGKPTAYVRDEQEANEVIENIKLHYVSKKDLAAIQEQKELQQPLPPLKKKQSRILDVNLDEKVSIQKDEVAPNQILSVDQAVDYLLKGTLKEKKYTVKDGDVLGQIAIDHHLKQKQILEMNPGIKEDSLKIGQELKVTAYVPLVHVIVQRETYKVEKVPYKKEIIEDKTMFKGDSKVRQKGQNGKSEITYIVTEENGTVTKKDIQKEKVIKKPVKYIVVQGTKVIPSRGSGSLSWPTNGGYVSSRMGYRWGKLHKGIDIARPSDRTIKAADNGVVVEAGWDSGGYGNMIKIDHRNGYVTIYGHLSSINVSVGQTVSKGSSIGIMGDTGDSTGIHLHFELHVNGSLKNPLDYLR
ncbi:M23 family metallopeptidase [Bacillus sp. FJAT-49736]|uniref:M23 family metallopeptidase n=1 Tax=Bacillus sp. FJAT-49736 TaxID=2833582 RepID=UPI001BC9F803|nr:M23 family metallopeptidase [Bacillus sp. FJAT-49736]MBS4175214.1 M23 family metallopeptidase [Bacillus sp. FJAT-49736]